MALPSTGMDKQWREPTAQNDPLSSGLPQMWADSIYAMQPPQFVPMGQQVFATAPVQASQPFVQQPAESASARGQQAQDAVMMASAMWQMMSSMAQQQQRMGSVPRGPGTPRMGCPAAAVTPVLRPRIPRINATPRSPAPSQITNVPIRTPLTPPIMRSTPRTGTQGYVLLQHQDVQPSLCTPDCDLSPVDHRPSVFTFDPPRLQGLPDNLDQTTQTAGQQEDEEQVLERDYEVFHEVVRSSLAPFRSSADDQDQEIGSLIPTDDVHKDKVTWELHPVPNPCGFLT